MAKLTSVVSTFDIKNTDIIFMLLPEWAKQHPPYSMARLIALAKANGYNASGIDLNIECFHDYNKNWKDKIDFNPWDPARDWKWRNFYFEELHQHLEPFLTTYLDKIEKLNPTALGFTLYYCNETPTQWFIKEIKKRCPDITILVGGPQCHLSEWRPIPEYDYIVSGEGEISLLNALEEIEMNGKPTTQRWFRQDNSERLDLSTLPNPDYSSFNFNLYDIPNGVNSELSRGCVAKCVYCLETHYWKYRDRKATSVLEEIIELYHSKGINYIYFIDSLINGNLTELRNFALGVVENNLKLQWRGYARADKRMDENYYRDLAAGGCIILNYGFESGSSKILEDMNKKSTRDDIEQNLKNASKFGISSDTNWIMGFPTETPQDFYETLVLVWRNRNHKFKSMSGGSGYGLAADTVAGQNITRWDISPSWFENNWITNSFTNSKIHRLYRVKCFNILTNIMNTHALFNDSQTEGVRNVLPFYKLTNTTGTYNTLEYEEFNFNIVELDINPFANSLVNEIWPLLRLLWKAQGAFDIEIIFDPELDFKEFGPFLCGDHSATYKFKINQEGEWSADFHLKFKQRKDAWDNGADQASAESVAASRARVFAVLNNKGESVWTADRHETNLKILEQNKKIDFSFEAEYKGTGQW